MEIAKIQVTGVKAALVGKGAGRWEIPAGILGGTLRFSYGADWQNLSKTVVFDCGGITKDVVNAGQVVEIPAEVVARPERKLLVGVYGVDGETGSATPTLWLEGYVCAAADPSGDVSTDPALPVWAQLESRIRALEERSNTCSVTYMLDQVICDNAVSTIPWQSGFTASLAPVDGYMLESVTVIMGGADITSQVLQDGLIRIPSVTGNLVITAKAVEILAAFVSYDAPVAAGYALNRSGAVIQATDKWNYTGYLPAAAGQTFRYTGDTSAYSEYVSVFGYDASGAAVKVLLGNGNFASGGEFTVPEGICALRCCWYVGSSGECGLEVLENQKDLAGEVTFRSGIVITGTGAESGKAGGGATDFIQVSVGDLALLYNIVPADGGRIAYYDSNRNFLDAVSIYMQGSNTPVMFSGTVSAANASYVRISTNVLANVRAAVQKAV